MAKLKVYRKDGSLDKEIEVIGKKALIDEILDQKIEIFFGCFGGSCGSCISKILSGKEYVNIEGIRPLIYKNLKENQFLPCVAKVKEDAPSDAVIEIQILL